MSATTIVSSGVASQENGFSRSLRLDFKHWLNSLRSGNLSAAKTAFKALKKDFENPSEARSTEQHAIEKV
jgi:hypothetical protein